MSIDELAHRHTPNDFWNRESSRQRERRQHSQQWVEYGVRIITDKHGLVGREVIPKDQTGGV